LKIQSKKKCRHAKFVHTAKGIPYLREKLSLTPQKKESKMVSRQKKDHCVCEKGTPYLRERETFSHSSGEGGKMPFLQKKKKRTIVCVKKGHLN